MLVGLRLHSLWDRLTQHLEFAGTPEVVEGPGPNGCTHSSPDGAGMLLAHLEGRKE